VRICSSSVEVRFRRIPPGRLILLRSSAEVWCELMSTFQRLLCTCYAISRGRGEGEGRRGRDLDDAPYHQVADLGSVPGLQRLDGEKLVNFLYRSCDSGDDAGGFVFEGLDDVGAVAAHPLWIAGYYFSRRYDRDVVAPGSAGHGDVAV